MINLNSLRHHRGMTVRLGSEVQLSYVPFPVHSKANG